MFYIYILKSDTTDRYYVGSTEDIAIRLLRHNAGRVRSTKSYRPWSIVYSEFFVNRQDAYRREKQIKSYKSGAAFKKLLPP